MQTGIIGLPFSGKTTLFNTLLAHKTDQDGARYKGEMERGIVKVPDTRLDYLSELFKPRKQINAIIEYVKIPGLEKEEHLPGGLPAHFLSNVKTVDMILIVVRDFNNEFYPHPSGSNDPIRDIKFIITEFLLNDMKIIEPRIEKLEKLIMKTQEDRDRKELEVLKKCLHALENEKPLSSMDITEQEEYLIRGYQFLSAKPKMFVINIDESDIPGAQEISTDLYSELDHHELTGMIALSAEIEYEITQLDPTDRKEFLEDIGIEEPATIRLINATYDLLGLQSFFTVGEDECRAWTIPRGTNARKAAGVIHSDMEKGFIRAEVVSFETLREQGSLQACRDKGLMRLEGKEYLVQDGDFINVRFNV